MCLSSLSSSDCRGNLREDDGMESHMHFGLMYLGHRRKYPKVCHVVFGGNLSSPVEMGDFIGTPLRGSDSGIAARNGAGFRFAFIVRSVLDPIAWPSVANLFF